MKFATVIAHKSVSVYNHPKEKEVDDITLSAFNVYWDIEIDEREWGIKNFDVTIHSVRGYLFLEKHGDTTEEVFTSEGWKIKNEIKIEGTIVPVSIEIDYKTETITVS